MSKNRLQELFQQNGLEMPEYATIGSVNNMWTSTVTVDVFGQIKHFIGVPNIVKKEAEKSAAKIAYESILPLFDSRDRPSRCSVEYVGPKSTVLIDLENKPHAIEQICNKYMLPSDDLRVIAFVTRDHGSIPKVKYPVDITLIDCKLRDAVDLAITLWLGRNLLIDASVVYYVWTSDKFGQTLGELVGKTAFMNGVVKHISHIDQI